VTSPARTIVDCADSGTEPSFIIEAVRRALKDGLIIAEELQQAAQSRPDRVRKLIDRAIKEAGPNAAVH
jgi:hypothetical protein